MRVLKEIAEHKQVLAAMLDGKKKWRNAPGVLTGDGKANPTRTDRIQSNAGATKTSARAEVRNAVPDNVWVKAGSTFCYVYIMRRLLYKSPPPCYTFVR